MVNDNTQFITNKKPSVDIKTMEMCSCIKSVLFAEKIYNLLYPNNQKQNPFI